jgi:hypothetical protein
LGPLDKAVFKFGRLDGRKHRPRGAVRGDTVGQAPKPAKPAYFGLTKLFDGNPIIGPTQHGTQGDGDDIDQSVGRRMLLTRIFDLSQAFSDACPDHSRPISP